MSRSIGKMAGSNYATQEDYDRYMKILYAIIHHHIMKVFNMRRTIPAILQPTPNM